MYGDACMLQRDYVEEARKREREKGSACECVCMKERASMLALP